jgi:streptomycin 6-kinase
MNSRFTVPPIVASNVKLRWPDRAHVWKQDAEREMWDICALYNARPRAVLPARFSFVVAADTPDGGGIVVRFTPDPDGPYQAHVAEALARLRVSPTVHVTLTTDTGTWLVLDEVRPGTPLADASAAQVSLDALTRHLIAMTGKPAPSDLPYIGDWLRDRLTAEKVTDLPPGATRAPLAERREAVAILDDLDARPVRQLCHGDVSPWNILMHGNDGWMLIDPRGMSGEVAYDVAVLSLKLTANNPNLAVTSGLANAVGVDTTRTQGWLLVAHAARV